MSNWFGTTFVLSEVLTNGFALLYLDFFDSPSFNLISSFEFYCKPQEEIRWHIQCYLDLLCWITHSIGHIFYFPHSCRQHYFVPLNFVWLHNFVWLQFPIRFSSLSIYLFISRLHTGHGAQHRAQTHNSEFKTRAEIKRCTLNWPSHLSGPDFPHFLQAYTLSVLKVQILQAMCSETLFIHSVTWVLTHFKVINKISTLLPDTSACISLTEVQYWKIFFFSFQGKVNIQ